MKVKKCELMDLIRRYLFDSFNLINYKPRMASSDNHIKALDYGFCLIGSYFKDEDKEKLFIIDLLSKELVRGKIEMKF